MIALLFGYLIMAAVTFFVRRGRNYRWTDGRYTSGDGAFAALWPAYWGAQILDAAVDLEWNATQFVKQRLRAKQR